MFAPRRSQGVPHELCYITHNRTDIYLMGCAVSALHSPARQHPSHIFFPLFLGVINLLYVLHQGLHVQIPASLRLFLRLFLVVSAQVAREDGLCGFRYSSVHH